MELIKEFELRLFIWVELVIAFWEISGDFDVLVMLPFDDLQLFKQNKRSKAK